jgi:hypothetical protein
MAITIKITKKLFPSMIERISQLEIERDSIRNSTKVWDYRRLKDFDFSKKVIDFKNFISQELNLSMFLPCTKVGDKWVIIVKPKMVDIKGSLLSHKQRLDLYNEDLRIYKEAKEKVLFEDVQFSNYNQGEDARFYSVNDTQVFNTDGNGDHLYWHIYTIEKLISESCGEITLKEQHLKLAGL